MVHSASSILPKSSIFNPRDYWHIKNLSELKQKAQPPRISFSVSSPPINCNMRAKQPPEISPGIPCFLLFLCARRQPRDEAVPALFLATHLPERRLKSSRQALSRSQLAPGSHVGHLPAVEIVSLWHGSMHGRRVQGAGTRWPLGIATMRFLFIF